MSLRAKTKAELRAPPPPEVEFFYDIEQRSDDWFDLHRGIPTASRFSVIMAEGKDGGESLSRQSYMNALAGEIITGRTEETFQSEAMRRGIEMEPLARDHFFSSIFDEPRLIGFVRRRLPNGHFIGCSPDSQIGDKPAGLEIKTMKPEKLVALLDGPVGGFPPRFKWQLQGTMLVTGWEEMKLQLYYAADPDRGEPIFAKPFTVIRSENAIRRLREQLEVFDYDLHQLVGRIRSRLK